MPTPIHGHKINPTIPQQKRQKNAPTHPPQQYNHTKLRRANGKRQRCLLVLKNTPTTEQANLFHYDGAERVEYGYSRLFCDVEKLEENEPMEALGLGILYEVSNASRTYPEKALATYKEHHKKLLETTKKQKEMFNKVVIIDCHSFSNEQAVEQGFSSDIPDICLINLR